MWTGTPAITLGRVPAGPALMRIGMLGTGDGGPDVAGKLVGSGHEVMMAAARPATNGPSRSRSAIPALNVQVEH